MANIFPDTITAGLTLKLPITLTAYPAPDWSLVILLRGAEQIDLTGTASNNQHLIEAPATTTAAWLPGAYWYSVRVTDGTDVFQVEEGTVTIKADLASAGAGYDGRGHVEKVLAAIEAVIEGRASRDQESYKINNRELKRTPIADLLKLRSHYRDELRRLEAAKKGQTLLGRQVLTRF